MKYYLVRYIDSRSGLIKDWGTWDDPEDEEYRGHLDTVIKHIHAINGVILDISIIKEE